MNCENLQFNLSLYADDILDDDEQRVLDAHLAACPLCRQKLDDYQSLRTNLRDLARSSMPANLLFSLRNRVAAELEPAAFKLETFASDYSFADWVKANLLSHGIGAAASFVIGAFLLFSMLSTNGEKDGKQTASTNSPQKQTVLLTGGQASSVSAESDLSPSAYAQSRLAVAGESPSVNPRGALVAMTKSFVRGKIKDDEVTVVADVLSSGLAQISEVVEPSRDRLAVGELEQALKNNPDYAPPFVPANIDGRSETVRVIFKIQTVNVSTSLKATKSKNKI